MRKIVLINLLILFASVVSLSQTKDGSWLTGIWQGTAYQSDPGESWTMTLDVSKGKYVVSYPSLKCGGDWRLVSMRHDIATFIETIRTGLKECEPDGNVVIERLNEDQISFQWSQTNSTKVLAYAVLDRKTAK